MYTLLLLSAISATPIYGIYKPTEINALPNGQRTVSVGYISDKQTLIKVFDAFTPLAGRAKVIPKVDFTKEIVVFLRNTKFVNSYSNVKVVVNKGNLSVDAISTRTATPITDYLHMVLVVVPKTNLKQVGSIPIKE